MRDRLKSPILTLAVLSLCFAVPHRVRATGTELEKEPQVDPSPCLAAISAADDDRITTACGELIDNDKTAKEDRVKALIGRAAVFARRDQIDRAIADYDNALRADTSLADIYNARGELWRRKGDRPKALRDFGAAIKLNPDHQAARANYKSLAQELERIGARMAIAGKPSFNCARAKRAVEKAICASPDLAELDSDIRGSYVRALREAPTPRDAKKLQREQDAYISRRNAEFGRPGYDLKKAMLERLQQINGVDGY